MARALGSGRGPSSEGAYRAPAIERRRYANADPGGIRPWLVYFFALSHISRHSPLTVRRSAPRFGVIEAEACLRGARAVPDPTHLPLALD
jgi:hypothetical protein